VHVSCASSCTRKLILSIWLVLISTFSENESFRRVFSLCEWWCDHADVMTKKDGESAESEGKGELPCFIRHFTIITRVCAVFVIIGTYTVLQL